MLIECAFCGSRIERHASHVNRSLAAGNKLYCGKRCSGLGRRKHKHADVKKQEKREYDARRRVEKAAELKAKKAAYFKATYDPVAAAIARKKRMPKHIEYCRRPEYVAWKSQYDKQYRAKEQFGEFWEAALALAELEAEVAKQATRYEIKLTNQTLNKAQRRKREHERTYRH